MAEIFVCKHLFGFFFFLNGLQTLERNLKCILLGSACVFLSFIIQTFYRAFEDEKKARMGVVECAKHELLQPFNVLYEKEGEIANCILCGMF